MFNFGKRKFLIFCYQKKNKYWKITLLSSTLGEIIFESLFYNETIIKNILGSFKLINFLTFWGWTVFQWGNINE